LGSWDLIFKVEYDNLTIIMGQINLEFLKNPSDTSIPVPAVANATHLQNNMPAIPGKQSVLKTTKYEREYDAFCRWAALPKDVRKPKRIIDFEKEWGLPKNYHEFFRQREDYQERRTKYFYDWLFEIWPDAVYEAYKRAMNRSTADFKVLAEIVGQKLEVTKPKMTVSPMVIVGVPQEDLNKLMQQKIPPVVQGQVVK
jgi:hypothetical protein